MTAELITFGPNIEDIRTWAQVVPAAEYATDDSVCLEPTLTIMCESEFKLIGDVDLHLYGENGIASIGLCTWGDTDTGQNGDALRRIAGGFEFAATDIVEVESYYLVVRVPRATFDLYEHLEF